MRRLRLLGLLLLSYLVLPAPVARAGESIRLLVDFGNQTVIPGRLDREVWGTYKLYLDKEAIPESIQAELSPGQIRELKKKGRLKFSTEPGPGVRPLDTLYDSIFQGAFFDRREVIDRALFVPVTWQGRQREFRVKTVEISIDPKQLTSGKAVTLNSVMARGRLHTGVDLQVTDEIFVPESAIGYTERYEIKRVKRGACGRGWRTLRGKTVLFDLTSPPST